MADRTDYTKLLGERLERAYRAKDDIKPPSAEDIARWKRLAQAKRKEKRKRMKLIASLASVFAVAFCISIVPMFKIPDAQAGEDYFVDLKDSRNDEESMIVESYSYYNDLPQDIIDDFFTFENLPEGYKLSEVKIITIGHNKRLESSFRNEEGNFFIIKQKNIDNGETEIITFENDVIENWNGTEVYIKHYTNNNENILYSFVYDKVLIVIESDKGVEKSIIQETIKEAIL